MSVKGRIAAAVLQGARGLVKFMGADAAAYLSERMTLTERVRLPEGALTLLSGNSALLYRARTVLDKEPETIAWIDGFREGACVWDVGANVGVYSLYAARQRKARVLAFEPASANYHVLNQHIELNDACAFIQAYCLAFSDQNGLGLLNMANTRAGGATNNFDAQGALSPYAPKTDRVFNQGMIGFSIDQFVRLYGPPFPEHLKIDVDGIEELILNGARDTLADPRLQSVLIELETVEVNSYERCLSIFRESGLVLAQKGILQALGSSMRPMNHIFVRNQPVTP